jgi:hypothetical protein
VACRTAKCTGGQAYLGHKLEEYLHDDDVGNAEREPCPLQPPGNAMQRRKRHALLCYTLTTPWHKHDSTVQLLSCFREALPLKQRRVRRADVLWHVCLHIAVAVGQQLHGYMAQEVWHPKHDDNIVQGVHKRWHTTAAATAATTAVASPSKQ